QARRWAMPRLRRRAIQEDRRPYTALRAYESSLCRFAGGDRDALPGNIARPIAAKESRERRDVFGRRHPPQRRPLDERLAHALDGHATDVGLSLDDPIDPISRDRAGRDRIDRDVVSAELEGEAARHSNLPGLRGAVAHAVREPPASRHR